MIRINDEIARVSAQVIRSELSDPRIGAVVSVIRAETTQDLKYCKIWVSIFGEESEKSATMEGLNKAAGFVRKRIAETVNLRQTPEIKFIYDDSIEHGMRMRKLIDEVNSGTDS
jgi:ribosome-binding factor A